jgi:hypothetical protein
MDPKNAVDVSDYKLVADGRVKGKGVGMQTSGYSPKNAKGSGEAKRT